MCAAYDLSVVWRGVVRCGVAWRGAVLERGTLPAAVGCGRGPRHATPRHATPRHAAPYCCCRCCCCAAPIPLATPTPTFFLPSTFLQVLAEMRKKLEYGPGQRQLWVLVAEPAGQPGAGIVGERGGRGRPCQEGGVPAGSEGGVSRRKEQGGPPAGRRREWGVCAEAGCPPSRCRWRLR